LTTNSAFIDKFRYNAAKSSEAQSRIKKLEKMPVLEPPENEYIVHFKFPDVEKLSPPIIQMSGMYPNASGQPDTRFWMDALAREVLSMHTL
jgi:ATPase subunit of ABC transporter with duplicated ATPase domains